MNQKALSDDEGIYKAFNSSESKREVFKIIREEKEALNVKEKRVRVKKKFKF